MAILKNIGERVRLTLRQSGRQSALAMIDSLTALLEQDRRGALPKTEYLQVRTELEALRREVKAAP
jgi:hypothetical protein